MGDPLEQVRMRRLLEVGRTLVSELDPDRVLDLVLETAREVTSARYAALGVLDAERARLERFITRGIDERGRRQIGDLPRGRGVLGVLIEDPRPLRLADVGQHPDSYGFPAGHPAMTSFLGVPILIRGEAWGNLYLTEKQGGDFDQSDEEAAVVLADWAAIAIENARLYHISEQHRAELAKALHASEATRDIAIAIGGELDLGRVLELIAKRGRALVGARSLVILLCDGDELVLAASAGYAEGPEGVRLPISETVCGQVMERRRPERINDIGARLGIDAGHFGVVDAHTALLVPLVYRNGSVGVLCAFDRGGDGEVFSADDELLLGTFAASAATAVAMAQSVQEERLRHSLAAAEAERRRWARELHDETLQGLGGLRVLLSAALRRGGHEQTQEAVRQAIEQIEQEIANLRAIITELRPAALDELGLASAISSLIERHREHGELAIEADIALADPRPGQPRLSPELETTIYRIVQEALTNGLKHAHASRMAVTVAEEGGEVVVDVRDDGAGFRPEAATRGYGLTGMRERVQLAGGQLEIATGEHGTRVRAAVPARHVAAESSAGADSSGVERAVP
jgi:two-component system, NarL family, sensor histidine kinase DevS